MSLYLILIGTCAVAFPILAVAGSLLGDWIAGKLPASWGGEPR